MFILFVMLISAHLAAFSAHIYTALTLQAQTVTYAAQRLQHEQYLQGVLSYGLCLLAHRHGFIKRLEEEKNIVIPCDIFNSHADGFMRSTIRYQMLLEGYLLEISLMQAGQKIGAMRARVEAQAGVEKVVYACVAFETF